MIYDPENVSKALEAADRFYKKYRLGNLTLDIGCIVLALTLCCTLWSDDMGQGNVTGKFHLSFGEEILYSLIGTILIIVGGVFPKFRKSACPFKVRSIN